MINFVRENYIMNVSLSETESPGRDAVFFYFIYIYGNAAGYLSIRKSPPSGLEDLSAYLNSLETSNMC